MLRREGYAMRMTQQLGAWRARFDALVREAGKPGARPGPDVRERLAASKAGCDAAVAKLAELRAAAAEYVRLRREMRLLWTSINDTPPAPPRMAKRGKA